VREKVMAAMRNSLTGPALAYLLKRAEQRVAERETEQPTEQKKAEARVSELRRKAERLVMFLAEGNTSSTVAAMLTETEAAIRQAEVDPAAVRTRAEDEVTLPSPEAIMLAATDISINCTKDPVGMRERFRGVLRDGKVFMEPQADGTFMARFKLLPLAFALNGDAAPKWLRDGGVYSESCGGTLDWFSPTEKTLYARRFSPAGACSFPGCPTLFMVPGYATDIVNSCVVGCP